ncbi:MAG: c-type cytochrome [Candidatus Kapabacteria bacterium]|nr:c-type cytochrome [Candidatus Kapabacteria bacterium]
MKYILFCCCVALCAFNHNLELLPVPKGWGTPTYNFNNNPLSYQTIQLGRALFYDPILSRNNTISCASCHSQFNAFAHADHALSHGIDDSIGTRNAPALMNLAWQPVFMWDGAVHHLDVQPLAPIHNPIEMDENIQHVVVKLRQSAVYPPLFAKAFGDTAITGERTLKALAQFMVTLVSANAKYDKVQRGELQFTPQVQNGYALFKTHCASCHAEPLFTTHGFANNGIAPDTTLHDIGRMRITQNADDSLLFKIPTLRNIEYTYPYMHDGRFTTLTQVLQQYTTGIHNSRTLAPQLRTPLPLTSNQRVDIIAFLLTLSDKDFLFNPQYSYPKDILK